LERKRDDVERQEEEMWGKMNEYERDHLGQL
jgi:hypothetical protein